MWKIINTKLENMKSQLMLKRKIKKLQIQSFFFDMINSKIYKKFNNYKMIVNLKLKN